MKSARNVSLYSEKKRLKTRRIAARVKNTVKRKVKNGRRAPVYRRSDLKAVKGRFFFGGVHVPDEKSLAKASPIDKLQQPPEVKIAMKQSLGRPAVPCVKAGDSVAEGQLIATADGAVSSNVFASISGTVTEICELENECGAKDTFIAIKGDGEGRKTFLSPLSDPSPEEIVQRIKDAGIVGLGGAGFPTAVKLKPHNPVDTFIINGSECEPYLTCDYRVMIENTDEVARGARYIAKALGVSDIIIGIETNKPDCIAAFEKYVDIKVVALRKTYPMGGEKQLIYSCTGRKVPAGKLPSDVGVIVNNVATCLAVCEAIELGKPAYEAILTVSGRAIKNCANVKVPVGTPFGYIVEQCGGEASAPKKVVLGGPMTGVAIKSYDSYVKKTTSGILLLSEKEAAAEEPTPCLNCGLCADHCPMHLMPMNTAFYSSAGDFENAVKLGGTLYCIECGVCEYVCPAKRPLLQAIRKTKNAVRAQGKTEGGK